MYTQVQPSPLLNSNCFAYIFGVFFIFYSIMTNYNINKQKTLLQSKCGRIIHSKVLERGVRGKYRSDTKA